MLRRSSRGITSQLCARLHRSATVGGRNDARPSERDSKWRRRLSKKSKRRRRSQLREMGVGGPIERPTGSGSVVGVPMRTGMEIETMQRRHELATELLRMRTTSSDGPRESLLREDPLALEEALESGEAARTSRNFNYLIRTWGVRGELEQAASVVGWMREEGVEVDEDTVCSLLQACGVAKNAEAATAILTELRGVEESDVGDEVKDLAACVSSSGVGSSFLWALVKSGEVKKAAQVFAEIVALDKVDVDATLATPLISGFGDVGDAEGALEVFRSLKRLGAEADVVAYTAAITACGKAGMVEMAQRLFSEMRSIPEMDITVEAANATLHAIARSPRDISASKPHGVSTTSNRIAKEALTLLSQFPSLGLVPDARSIQAALLACSHDGEVERAREILRRAINQHQVPLTTSLLNAMLTVHMRALSKLHSSTKSPPRLLADDVVAKSTDLGVVESVDDVALPEVGADREEVELMQRGVRGLSLPTTSSDATPGWTVETSGDSGVFVLPGRGPERSLLAKHMLAHFFDKTPHQPKPPPSKPLSDPPTLETAVRERGRKVAWDRAMRRGEGEGEVEELEMEREMELAEAERMGIEGYGQQDHHHPSTLRLPEEVLGSEEFLKLREEMLSVGLDEQAVADAAWEMMNGGVESDDPDISGPARDILIRKVKREREIARSELVRRAVEGIPGLGRAEVERRKKNKLRKEAGVPGYESASTSDGEESLLAAAQVASALSRSDPTAGAMHEDARELEKRIDQWAMEEAIRRVKAGTLPPTPDHLLPRSQRERFAKAIHSQRQRALQSPSKPSSLTSSSTPTPSIDSPLGGFAAAASRRIGKEKEPEMAHPLIENKGSALGDVVPKMDGTVDIRAPGMDLLGERAHFEAGSALAASVRYERSSGERVKEIGTRSKDGDEKLIGSGAGDVAPNVAERHAAKVAQEAGKDAPELRRASEESGVIARARELVSLAQARGTSPRAVMDSIRTSAEDAVHTLRQIASGEGDVADLANAAIRDVASTIIAYDAADEPTRASLQHAGKINILPPKTTRSSSATSRSPPPSSPPSRLSELETLRQSRLAAMLGFNPAEDDAMSAFASPRELLATVEALERLMDDDEAEDAFVSRVRINNIPLASFLSDPQPTLDAASSPLLDEPIKDEATADRHLQVAEDAQRDRIRLATMALLPRVEDYTATTTSASNPTTTPPTTSPPPSTPPPPPTPRLWEAAARAAKEASAQAWELVGKSGIGGSEIDRVQDLLQLPGPDAPMSEVERHLDAVEDVVDEAQQATLAVLVVQRASRRAQRSVMRLWRERRKGGMTEKDIDALVADAVESAIGYVEGSGMARIGSGMKEISTPSGEGEEALAMMEMAELVAGEESDDHALDEFILPPVPASLVPDAPLAPSAEHVLERGELPVEMPNYSYQIPPTESQPTSSSSSSTSTLLLDEDEWEEEGDGDLVIGHEEGVEEVMWDDVEVLDEEMEGKGEEGVVEERLSGSERERSIPPPTIPPSSFTVSPTSSPPYPGYNPMHEIDDDGGVWEVVARGDEAAPPGMVRRRRQGWVESGVRRVRKRKRAGYLGAGEENWEPLHLDSETTSIARDRILTDRAMMRAEWAMHRSTMQDRTTGTGGASGGEDDVESKRTGWDVGDADGPDAALSPKELSERALQAVVRGRDKIEGGKAGGDEAELSEEAEEWEKGMEESEEVVGVEEEGGKVGKEDEGLGELVIENDDEEGDEKMSLDEVEAALHAALNGEGGWESDGLDEDRKDLEGVRRRVEKRSMEKEEEGESGEESEFAVADALAERKSQMLSSLRQKAESRMQPAKLGAVEEAVLMATDTKARARARGKETPTLIDVLLGVRSLSNPEEIEMDDAEERAKSKKAEDLSEDDIVGMGVTGKESAWEADVALLGEEAAKELWELRKEQELVEGKEERDGEGGGEIVNVGEGSVLSAEELKRMEGRKELAQRIPPGSKGELRLKSLQWLQQRLTDGLEWTPRSLPRSKRGALEALKRDTLDIYRFMCDDEMTQGARPDVVTLNVITGALASTRDVRATYAFVAREFPRHQLLPDHHTVRHLVRMHADLGQPDIAETVLRQAEEHGHVANEHVFGSVIHAYSRANNLKRAVHLLQEMRARSLHCPDRYVQLLRMRMREHGVEHPDVPAHPHAWQFEPHIMKKRLARSKELSKRTKATFVTREGQRVRV